MLSKPGSQAQYLFQQLRGIRVALSVDLQRSIDEFS